VTATLERPTVIQGCESPRIFTPPRRELVAGTAENGYADRTTDGFAAIAFAELLGFTLFPWQRWLLIHALELTEDGIYRFRFLIVLVGRQNGKSLMLMILALWHIYSLGSKQVIGTAQDLARSEKSWEEAAEFAEDDEDLSELIEKVNRGHPKYLKLAKTEAFPWFREYRVAAATRRGGRGFSGDLILLDELREHQTWQCWSAVTNAMNARPRGQAWAFSNAGDVLSVVLRFLRAAAHRDLGWPDGDQDAEILDALDAEMEEFLAEQDGLDDAAETGFFEWSAPPKAKRTDRQAWAQANPSMDHTEVTPDCVTQRVIAAALKTNPRAEFETEVLCRWQTMADGGPFPEGAWRATLDNGARPAENASWRPICVDVSWDRSRSYIARAGLTAEQLVVVGIAADRAGTDWVVPWLVENRDTFSGVVLQSNGAPVTSLIDGIEAATLEDGSPAGLTVLKWGGPDLGVATGTFYGLLDEENGPLRLRHLAHPGLDGAATTARGLGIHVVTQLQAAVAVLVSYGLIIACVVGLAGPFWAMGAAGVLIAATVVLLYDPKQSGKSG
jgi:hypothetical protein